MNNPLRNYNYLVVNSLNNSGLIIDPTLAEYYENFLSKNILQAEAILLTHEHGDHIAAVSELKERYQIPVYAHFKYYSSQRVDHVVCDDTVLNFKTSICRVITCPGHVADHVSFYFPVDGMLFCGDTIFNGGVGNVKDNSADVTCLYESIKKLRFLLNTTKLYPAHDYFENNLSFARSIDPEDKDYKQWFEKVRQLLPEDRPVTTLSDENRMNIFFRANELKLQILLHAKNPNIVDTKTAFYELRARKDVF